MCAGKPLTDSASTFELSDRSRIGYILETTPTSYTSRERNANPSPVGPALPRARLQDDGAGGVPQVDRARHHVRLQGDRHLHRLDHPARHLGLPLLPPRRTARRQGPRELPQQVRLPVRHHRRHLPRRGALFPLSPHLSFVFGSFSIHTNLRPAQVVGYGIAAAGFLVQMYSGFSLPFPLNIFLLPLRIGEWAIVWIIN